MLTRPLKLLLVALASLGLFAGAYWGARQVCATQAVQGADDLEWLRQEFHLSDAEMDRVRPLHAGYLPKCAEMCARIAAKKSELEHALTGATNLTANAEAKLTELSLLRAQCQTQMLRHFAEVSQAMPPEQGRRYLAEMQRLTLGFHDQFEQSMAAPGHSHHGHP